MATDNVQLVTAAEADKVARTVRSWLNTYADKPRASIDYEFLADPAGLTLTSIQAPYKTAQYIDGTYQAQYQFAIIYRTIPANASERLDADEALNAYGAWAETMTGLTLGENMKAIKVTRNSLSALTSRFEDGAEDHQIQMTLLYEVI